MAEQVQTSPALHVSEQELLLAHERVNWVLADSLAASKVVARAVSRLPKASASVKERLRKRGSGAGYRVILDPPRLFDYHILELLEREEVRQEGQGLRFVEQCVEYERDRSGGSIRQ